MKEIPLLFNDDALPLFKARAAELGLSLERYILTIIREDLARGCAERVARKIKRGKPDSER